MKFCHYIYELHPYLHPELNFKLEFPTRSWSFRVYFPCHHKSFAKNNNSVFFLSFHDQSLVACEQALLAKRSEPRENARATGRSLARSRETRFTRPNRTACSQAKSLVTKHIWYGSNLLPFPFFSLRLNVRFATLSNIICPHPCFFFISQVYGLHLWKQHFVQKSDSMMLVYSLCKTKQIGS